jgi:HD-GYP domain-containing protein (c-di-GMP phosphodiesterase class II)
MPTPSRLAREDIALSQPLPWDVCDAAGHLLLARGTRIEDEAVVDRLLERGACRSGVEPEPAQEQAAVAGGPVFDRLTYLARRLQEVFAAVFRAQLQSLGAEVVRLADAIQALCDQDSEAGLAALHLAEDSCYTAVHPVHTALLSAILISRLGLEPGQRRAILCAALTANLSCVKQQETLQRQPQSLSEAQRAAVCAHPLRTVELLCGAGVDDRVWLDAARSHHERIDGTGYPARLCGEAIPVGARIIALADAYSAMISRRSYRQEMLAREALRELFLQRGAQVDEVLVQLLIRQLGVFPPGAFVRLHDGEIAVVTRRGNQSACPTVYAVLSARGGPYEHPQRRDTGRPEFQIDGPVPRQPLAPAVLRQIWAC